MKHDEKKIEELIRKNIGYANQLLLNGEDIVSKTDLFICMKQYAEHMVQQERERIEKELLSGEYQGDELGGIYLTDKQVGKIIKAINQE
jgi:hypothetical protein